MKKNQTTLEQTLQEWQVATPLPPRFCEQVWKRIERTEMPTVSVADALRAWFTIAFARPAFAVAFVSVLLAMGLAFGSLQANYRAAQVDRQLEARYVQSIDPYLKSQ